MLFPCDGNSANDHFRKWWYGHNWKLLMKCACDGNATECCGKLSICYCVYIVCVRFWLISQWIRKKNISFFFTRFFVHFYYFFWDDWTTLLHTYWIAPKHITFFTLFNFILNATFTFCFRSDFSVKWMV